MSVRIGAAGPVWGTTDVAWGIINNWDNDTTVDEAKLMRGDNEVYAVEQHSKEVAKNFEYTVINGTGPDADDVGTGTAITITDPESGGTEGTAYVKRANLRWQKGDFKSYSIESTFWPYLGTLSS